MNAITKESAQSDITHIWEQKRKVNAHLKLEKTFFPIFRFYC